MAKNQKYSHPKNTKNSTKIIISLAVVALIVAGLAGLFVIRNRDNKLTTSSGNQGTRFAPPTEEEKKEADANKEALVENQKQLHDSSSSPTQSRQASLVITEATSSGVRAYITGVFEDGGICTATATKAGQSVIKTSAGFKNVSYTQCAPMDWGSALGVGSWKIQVSYKSTSSEATSSTTIEVQ
jgi:hypothetical protein